MSCMYSLLWRSRIVQVSRSLIGPRSPEICNAPSWLCSLARYKAVILNFNQSSGISHHPSESPWKSRRYVTAMANHELPPNGKILPYTSIIKQRTIFTVCYLSDTSNLRKWISQPPKANVWRYPGVFVLDPHVIKHPSFPFLRAAVKRKEEMSSSTMPDLLSMPKIWSTS